MTDNSTFIAVPLINLSHTPFRTWWISIAALILISACGGNNPELLLKSAYEFLSKNDAKSAEIQIKNVLQTNPDLPEARYVYGLALLSNGKPGAAEVEFRKALLLNYSVDLVIPRLASSLLAQGQYNKLVNEFPTSTLVRLTGATANADFQTSLSNAYSSMGNSDLAGRSLQKALAADPSYVPALIARARQIASKGDFSNALAAVDEVLIKSPKEYDAWKLKGDIVIYGKKDFVEALKYYNRAVEIKSDFLPARFAVLSVLLQRGNHDEAAAQIEELKKISVNHPETLYFEAQLSFAKKDLKKARAVVQQLLKSVTISPLIYQLAGAIELEDGSLDQAELYLSRAVQISPKQPVARRLLVICYLQRRQPDKALATLQAAISKGELPSELYSVAGEVYLQLSDMKTALQFFEKASKQDPDDPRKRTAVALTQLLSGETSTGFDALERISVADKGTAADLALISAHMRLREFQKALLAIDRFEAKQPNNPTSAMLRGRAQLALQDIAAARNSFEKALAADTGYFPAVASLSALDVSAKKPEDAKRRLEKFLERNPKDVRALLALTELAVVSGAPLGETTALAQKGILANPTHPGPRIILVDLYLQAKNFKQASLVAQDAVATIPGNPDVLDAMGRVQRASGELNQAIGTFIKLAELRPNSPQPHMRLAEVYAAAKNPAAAEQSLRKALEIRPDFLEAQRDLATLSFTAQKFEEAQGVARQIQKQRPLEVVGFLLEGDIYAAQKKWDAAAAAYRMGLAKVSSAEATMKLISVLGVSSKGGEAEKLAAAWLRDHPADARFLLFLGDDALGRKDFIAAEKNYAAVVKVVPNSAAAYNNLAWVTAKLKKEGALAYAIKANELSPNQPAFMDTWATLLADDQKYAQAIQLQLKASALEPANGLLKLSLAKIYIKAGDKKSAKSELDALARMDKSFPGQAEVATLQQSL